MNKEDNLIKFTSEQSREEAKRNGSKGGVASGEARRRAKSMREWAKVIGEQSVTLKDVDGNPFEGDVTAAIVMKQSMKAVRDSDTRAAEFIMKVRGEDVVKVEQTFNEEKAAAIREELGRMFGL